MDVNTITITGRLTQDPELKQTHSGVTICKISIANNYLNQKEMTYLERIVTMYLDYAELQTERKIPMSMEDWAKRLDGFLEFNGNEILTGSGKISHEQAKLHAETEYEKYRLIQDRLFESDFDRVVKQIEDSNDK